MSHSIICLNNASIYQKNILMLSNVNINIQRGEFVYIVGKTGSGKSTLMKVLYGELPLLSGNGSVSGFNLRTLKMRQISKLRMQLGIIFQDFQLLTDRNINDNLLFVLKAIGWNNKYAIKKRIEEVLNSVGMTSKKEKKPYELSGGEQQKIAIARSLLNYPKLILADEPTSNLDPETSLEVIKLLNSISTEINCTVLIITHNYNIIKNFSSHIFECKNGKINKIHSNELFS